MGKRKISNYMILIVTILVLTIVITIAATNKVTKEHNDKLIYALTTKVEYQAKRCYLEGKCNGNVTLNNLYELGYLTELTNPVTKEVLDSNLVVVFSNGKYTFKLA